ncbi:MAG: DUF2059 domain-containing protein [Burkholderiales bacterium]|nr:DUF2059 domain-containing protein [Burkholderiales bacterium]
MAIKALRLKISIALVVGGIIFSAHAQENKHRSVIQEMLTRTSTIEGFMAGLRHGLAGGDQSNAGSKKRAACVIQSMNRSQVDNQMIKSHMTYFSIAEASDIVAFYKTPSGQKIAGYAADVASGKLSPDPNVTPPGMTDADVAAFEKFSKQTAGGKRMNVIGQKPVAEASEILKPSILKLFEKCKTAS